MKPPSHSKADSAARDTSQEENMTAQYGGSVVPKRGDRVATDKQEGVFEVVDINLLMQTANVKSTDDRGHVTANVPWTSLKPVSK
jgi:hypothetical protein